MAETTPSNKKAGDHHDRDEIPEKEEIEEDNAADMSQEIEEESVADENRHNTGSSSSRISPNLTELNLVMLLSYLSTPPGELTMDVQDDHDKTKSNLKDSNQHHRSVPGISKRQRVTNEFRASSPQSARSQTKIKDCRHSRRM